MWDGLCSIYKEVGNRALGEKLVAECPMCRSPAMVHHHTCCHPFCTMHGTAALTPHLVPRSIPPLPINKGLAEAVGVSNYGAEQLARIHDYLDARGVPLASAQVQYSLLSRGGAQESVRREAEERGIALIAYSPLALGERRA